MSDLELTLSGQRITLPTLIIQNSEGITREVISSNAIIEAIAVAWNLDLNNEEAANQAYELEERVAATYKLSEAKQLRPPLVPLPQAGMYRGLPIKLDMGAIHDFIASVVDMLNDREAREQMESESERAYLRYTHNSTRVCLRPDYLHDSAESLREIWKHPKSAVPEIVAALGATLIEFGAEPAEDENGQRWDHSFLLSPDVEKASAFIDVIAATGKFSVTELASGYINEKYGTDTRPYDLVREFEKYNGIYKAEAIEAIWRVLERDLHELKMTTPRTGESLITTTEQLEELMDKVESPYALFTALKDGKFTNKPFEFPHEDGIMPAIVAATKQRLKGTTRFLFKDTLADALSAEYGTPVSLDDVVRHVQRPGSPLTEALRLYGFSTDDRWLTAYYHGNEHRDAYGFVHTVEKMEYDPKTCTTRVGNNSSNLPVHVTHLLANKEDIVIAMSMFGPRESIVAAFAALFTNSRQRTNFSVGMFSNLVPMDRRSYFYTKTIVPGTKSTWFATLVASQAIPDRFNLEDSSFYVLRDDDGFNAPPHFIGMLDRAIYLPVKPQWADYLWRRGIINGLIKPLPEQIGNLNGFQVNTRTDAVNDTEPAWKPLIADALKARRISIFDTEPEQELEPEVTEEPPVTVEPEAAVEITDELTEKEPELT